MVVSGSMKISQGSSVSLLGMGTKEVFDIGLVDFVKGLEFQRQIFSRVREGRLSQALILCSHFPVITVGRGGTRANVLVPESRLCAQGIGLFDADRGGDVTYHGPGQLIVYPVMPLYRFNKDIHAYLDWIQQVVIGLLTGMGVAAERRKGATGVWVKDQKIASIGIAVKHWIAFHGFALNITRNDLENFSLIRPCGMDIAMTSIESQLEREVPLQPLKEALLRSICHDQSHSS